MAWWKFWERPIPAADDAAELSEVLSGRALESRMDAAEALAVQRGDGYANALTGLGVLGRDKTVETTYSGDDLTAPEAEELWTYNDLAATIVEALPDDVFKEGYELRVPDDAELAEAMQAWGEELGVEDAVHHAKCLERAIGGAAIFPVMNDGAGGLDKPLRMNGASVRNLVVFDGRELQAVEWGLGGKPGEGSFAGPQLYQYVPSGASDPVNLPYGTRIHASRLILFPGVRTTRRMMASRSMLRGWGWSVLARCHRVLMQFGVTWDSAHVLVQDFSQAIFGVKGLAEMLASHGDEALRKRAMTMSMMASVLRGYIIDADETYERKSTSVAGLPDLMDRFANRLAAAARMPVTRMMGQAPAGLNATGDADLASWNDVVKADQRKTTPRMERLYRLMFLSREGPARGKEPKNWGVQFCPLEQMSEIEQADLRNKQADTDVKYIQAGVLTPEEVATSRFGGDRWSMETVVNFEDREPPTPPGGEEGADPEEKDDPEDPDDGEKEKKPKPREDVFDPDQERAEDGKWTSGGGAAGGAKAEGGGEGSAPKAATTAAPKTAEHVASIKSTLEIGKAATLQVKELRALAKKDPSNEAVAAKLKEAEKAAKSIHHYAWVANHSETPEVAAKALKSMQKHADRIAKLNAEAKSAKAPAAKAPEPKPAAHPPPPAATSLSGKPSFSGPLADKMAKLWAAAHQTPPAGTSPQKLAAIQAAKDALAAHAGAKTPAELQAAEIAFSKVATQAAEAGTLWGSQYKDLSSHAFEASVGSVPAAPKETFGAGDKNAVVKTHVPATSARPLSSIKGDVVPTSTFTEHRTAYTKLLTSAEKNAVLDYSGSAYSHINASLRKDVPPTATVKAIDSAIAKSPAPKDIVVHRGMNDSADGLWAKMQPGDQFVEKGFCSTAAGGKGFSGAVRVEITVPKGYPIAPIPSQHSHEMEYLMRRNTRFEVTKVSKVGGKTHVQMTVIHDEED